VAQLRRGRKLATTQGLQTIYLQMGDEPADSDPCVGMMLTPDLAMFVVEAVNADETFARLVLLG
jgi:hypothetical protein